MYAVCFPGKPDIVVQPESSSDKIVYGRHLTKSNNFFLIILSQNIRRFMTLVSTIGFSYTHHPVHYPETILDTSDSRNQNGGHQTNKIGNRGGGVGSEIEYHMVIWP